MAVVDLQRCWFHSAADLSDRLEVEDVTGHDDATSIAGAEKITASGRVRSVTAVGESRSISLAVSAATAVQLEWIRGHQGQLVWFRNPDGLVMAGIYRDLQVSRILGGARLSDMSVTFIRVTHSLEV